jgi:hypothetical protein
VSKSSSFLNITTRITNEIFKKAQTFAALNQAIDANYKQGESSRSQVELSVINKSTFISRGQMNDALIRKSELTIKISELVKKIVDSFKLEKTTVGNRRYVVEDTSTRYGGHVDTIVAMTAFDLLVSIIGNYGNKNIVGLHIKDNEETLVSQERIDNHSSSIREITERLNKEIVKVQHGVFGVLNSIKNLRNSIDNVINYANSENSIKELKKLSSLFEGNLSLLQMLFDENQIRLFSNAVADIQAALRPNNLGASYSPDANKDDNFDADDEIKILDDSVMSPVMKNALEELFSQDQYSSSDAIGQKIFTIGIPQGFLKNLQQKVDTKKIKKMSSFVRQNDIFKIKIYKIDLQNPDIIYKPKDFLFEMSRFPARNNSLIKTSNKKSSSVLDVIKRFPTRDYSGTFVEGGSFVQYLQAQGKENNALTQSEYSFLSERQKTELYTNHVLSYLYEIYLKVMTGITTADYHFDIIPQTPPIDSSFTEEIMTNELVNFAGTKTRPRTGKNEKNFQEGMFFKQKTNKTNRANSVISSSRSNPGGTTGVSFNNAATQYDNPVSKTTSSLTKEQAIKQLSSITDVNFMKFNASVINETARMLTPQADPLAVSKRLLTPKQFDRIFNVIVDPQSFEIDDKMTNSTPHGKQALELMIRQGDILPISNSETFHPGSKISAKRYVSRRKNISEGDLVFDKYIVAVETFGDEE